MSEPPNPSLLFANTPTPVRDWSSSPQHGDDFGARRTPGFATPGSRYLSNVQARPGGGSTGRRHAAPGELPPPPSSSLFDVDAVSLGTPSRFAQDATLTPARDAALLPSFRPQAPPELGLAGPGAGEYWVTVFGFPPEWWHPPQQQLNALLREFSKCGEIRKSGSFCGDDCNWVHLCYGHRDEAERALRRSGGDGGGFPYTNTLVIGVKPLDPHQRALLSDDAASNPPLLRERAPPPAATQVAPPYLLSRPASGAGTLSSVAPDVSLLYKVQHWVLGL